MPLFNKHGRNFGEALIDQAKSVTEDPLLKNVIRNDPVTWSDAEVTNYFLKSFSTAGDLSSYWHEKGFAIDLTLKIDAIALAAACAGAPAPEVGVFAEVGAGIKVEKTRSRLLVGWVGPRTWDFNGDELTARDGEHVALLLMEGYKFKLGVSVSAEIGVKTPDIPGLPNVTGGSYKGTKDTKIEKGTYAELVSFEVGAKASYASQASIEGERIYMADPTPNFLPRETEAFGTLLKQILELGDKKSVIKAHVMELFNEPAFADLKPQSSWFARNISGGNIPTDKIIGQLQKGLAKQGVPAKLRRRTEANIHNLKLFNDRAGREPYCYLSLWGMKPGASAGVQITAEASFKVNGGVGGVEAGVGGTLQGPKVETSLKYTRYRLQLCLRAEDQDGDRHRRLVVTQDTKIIYGQTRLTLVGVEGHVTAKAEQTVFDGEKAGKAITSGVRKGVGKAKAKINNQPSPPDPEDDDLEVKSGGKGRSFGWAGRSEGSATAEASGNSLSAKASAQGSAHNRLTEAFGSAEAEASLNKIGAEAKGGASVRWEPNALNYMQYEAGFAVWATPPHPKAEKADQEIALGPGSGYAFGQSVDIVHFIQHAKKSQDAGELSGYMQGLAGSLGVSYRQLWKFLDGIQWLVDFWADPNQIDPAATPSAFLIEASFAVEGKTVPARYRHHRWVPGPFGMKTLIGHMSKDHSHTRLQAIRLRYRLSDLKDSTKTFSLGAKYIVSFGISLKAVERAGSEGIINLGTVWYGRNFEKYNGSGDLYEGYDRAVPYAQLLHQ